MLGQKEQLLELKRYFKITKTLINMKILIKLRRKRKLIIKHRLETSERLRN